MLLLAFLFKSPGSRLKCLTTLVILLQSFNSGIIMNTLALVMDSYLSTNAVAQSKESNQNVYIHSPLPSHGHSCIPLLTHIPSPPKPPTTVTHHVRRSKGNRLPDPNERRGHESSTQGSPNGSFVVEAQSGCS